MRVSLKAIKNEKVHWPFFLCLLISLLGAVVVIQTSIKSIASAKDFSAQIFNSVTTLERAQVETSDFLSALYTSSGLLIFFALLFFGAVIALGYWRYMLHSATKNAQKQLLDILKDYTDEIDPSTLVEKLDSLKVEYSSELWKQLEEMVSQIVQKEKDVNDEVVKFASGDYSILDSEPEYYLLRRIKEGVLKMNTTLSEISMAVDSVVESSSGFQEMVVQNSSSCTMQNESVGKISSIVSEVSDGSNEVAESVGNSVENLSDARRAASEGLKVMGEMTVAMHDIANSSKDVAKVLSTIEDIAFQTNLLALNAAVEAARAGQHGRGFAVVAEEVRNLSNRSAEASKETASLIDKAIGNSKRGAALVGDVESSFEEIEYNLEELQGVNDGLQEIATNLGSHGGAVTDYISNLNVESSDIKSKAEMSQTMAASIVSSVQNLRQLLEQYRLSDLIDEEIPEVNEVQEEAAEIENSNVEEYEQIENGDSDILEDE